jgi:uncharacterized protein
MPNRLADETSPYLRQHADNPVAWYPWGDEAFRAARERDVPILLSVGYSACHWCHVMAHESFEDDTTAAIMNERFVNLKVDREERPDVDAVYMEAVQALSGRGGWPMTVFLLPDGRPFFGGTYFPPRRPGTQPGRAGMMSFPDLLERIDEVWRTRRSELDDQAGALTDAISRTPEQADGATPPGPGVLETALAALVRQSDVDWGGFGDAPKFPQTMNLELALRIHARTGSPDALAIVTRSLDAMAAGGIYDHLGGGFARYSTDRRWLVPHFEKMLYDQALLARVYLHAWQVTGAARYRQVLDETIGYVLRDLRHPDGGFCSAEDADSADEQGRSVEGAFYVWTPDQVRSALDDPAAASAAIEWWGVTDQGNFHPDHHGGHVPEGARGWTILHRPLSGELIRPELVERARQGLFEARERRPRPGLDDKVLAEWNGLMVATLAEAAAATGEQGWLDAAIRAAEHLLSRLRRADGRWLRTAEGGSGRAPILAFAADHGALLDAFTRLYEATSETRWLTEACAVADALIELFWDDEHGGVFTAGADAPALVTRPKDLLDNATPSANSLAAVGLARLGVLTGVERYREHAEAILTLLGGDAATHPTAFAHLLGALDLLDGGAIEVVVAGRSPELVAAVQRRYSPGVVLAWGEPFDSPLWAGREPTGDGPARAFVCRDYTCEQPVTEVDDLLALLDGTTTG